MKKLLITLISVLVMAVSCLMIACGGEKTITVSFDSAGGSQVQSVTINKDGSQNISFPPPSYLGYDFMGWYDGERLVLSFSEINEDVTLVARWQAHSYTISYNGVNGVENDNPTSYTIESSTITLKNLNKTGYEFLGWYNGDDVKVESIEKGSTGNLSLTAKWQKEEYSIVYNDKFNVENDNKTSYNIETPTFNLNGLEKTGYEFLGWYNGDDVKVESIEAGSIGNLSLTAKWQTVPYTITYQDSFGVEHQNQTSYNIETPTFILDCLQKTGYTFLGWYKGDQKVDIINVGSTGDITLVAKWDLVVYDVTYDLDGGNYVEGQSNPTTCTVVDDITLVNPYKEGFSFEGWYATDGRGLFTKLINRTSNLSLKAVWGPLKYNVYYIDELSAVNPNPFYYTVENGNIPLQPAVKDGYKFLGWYNQEVNGEKVEFIEVSHLSPVILYARWEIENFVITYQDEYEIENSNEKEYNIESADIILLDLQKNGYNFLGWYNGDQKVESIVTGSTGNLTLVARWEKAPYTIEYTNLKEIDNSQNQTSYFVDTPTFSLLGLSLDGYSFEGWYDQEGNLVEQIVQGSYGNLVLKAKWVPTEYNVTFNLNALMSNGSTAQTKVNNQSSLENAVVKIGEKLNLGVAMLNPVSNGAGGYYDSADAFFAYEGWCLEVDGKLVVINSNTVFNVDTVGDVKDITIRPYFMSLFVPNV